MVDGLARSGHGAQMPQPTRSASSVRDDRPRIRGHRVGTVLRRLGCPTFGLVMLALATLPARASPWRWQVAFDRGVPGGFIKVRENAVQGTPLPLGSALGLDYVQRLRLGATDTLAPGRAWVLHLDLARFYGSAQFQTPVYFNGVELAPGRPLVTDTNPVNNWQFTALYRQDLVSRASGRIRLDGEVGFTYVGLTYDLQGHPFGATNSAELSGATTHEDFITQELPEPLIGARLRWRLARHWNILAQYVGGHLPRLYSQRNEGGKVYVTQTNEVAQLGLSHWLAHGVRLEFGWYDRYYMQHEQSAQDGNYIRMNEHGLYMDLSSRF